MENQQHCKQLLNRQLQTSSEGWREGSRIQVNSGWERSVLESWKKMPLRPASLLLLGVALGAALGVFVPESCCGCPSHFLRYYYMEVSEPGQEQPQFFIRGYLDDQPITHFGSLTWRVAPLVPWMEKAEKETFLSLGWVFGADLKKLSKLNQPTKGFHTWQAILGCELREDGSKGQFFRYGYDGRDFISFANETLTWVAAQPQAEKVKQKWEEKPEWSRRNKDYLEKTCIEWLQKYLSYRKKTPEDTKPPVGTVTHKVVNDSLEVLICHAFGFYPKKIQANWTRDGEVCQNETLHRNVVPNSDGTYYVWLIIKIDPKERDRFQCHLNHKGLQEPLVLALKEETANILWIMVEVGTVVVVLVPIALIICVTKCTGIPCREILAKCTGIPCREILAVSQGFELRPMLGDQDQGQQDQDQGQQDQDQGQQDQDQDQGQQDRTRGSKTRTRGSKTRTRGSKTRTRGRRAR